MLHLLIAPFAGMRLLRVLLLCVASTLAVAAEVTDATQTLPSLEDVQRQISILGAAGSEDPLNARLLEIHQRNAQDLAAITENRDSSARYLRLYQEVPEKTERYTRELTELQRQARSASSLAKGVAVQRLESMLRATRARLTELRGEETSVRATVANLQSRVEAARQELNALTTSATVPDKKPAIVAGENPALTRARQEQWLIGQLPPQKTVAVWNKADLPHGALPEVPFARQAVISAKERTGLDALRKTIDAVVWEKGPPSREEVLIT
ncbi:MAG TPA: hypothetical protein PLN78_06805, partial [Pseudomonadales bacterium]|nr:hypothetical protein [Pseudomonadales bacterium]